MQDQVPVVKEQVGDQPTALGGLQGGMEPRTFPSLPAVLPHTDQPGAAARPAGLTWVEAAVDALL
jgi:hypothetical protein